MPTSRVKLALSDGPSQLRAFSRQLAQDEGEWREFEVANGASGTSIDSATIDTIDILYIESDQSVTVVINGANTAYTIDANGFILLWGSSVTTLTISNSSGSTANIKIYMAGT